MDHLSTEGSSQDLCGWRRITPAWLQKFHKPRWLLTSLCLCSITQGMLINGVVPVSLSTLEKRFGLSSFQSSIFAVSYDIAICVSLIPVTHFGGKGHKGRWLAVGMLIMAVGSAMITVPQFISGPYHSHWGANLSKEAKSRCLLPIPESSNHNPKPKAKDSSENFLYFLLLVTGQILHGVGGTPIYTLGITFLNESVDETKSAFYLGIFLGASVLGPVLGFIGGGFFLQIHGDFLKVDIESYRDEIEDWYGAWWLGFTVTALLSVVAAFFMSGFASKLPDSPKREINPQISFSGNGDGHKGFLQNVMRLCTSWTFVWLIAVDCLEGILATGIVNFFPKVLENFFSVSASTAALVTGGAVVPSAVIGTVLGGWMVKKLELDVSGMCTMAFLLDCTCIVFGLSFLIHCPIRDIVGVTKPYGYLPNSLETCSESSLSISLNHSCHWKTRVCEESCWEPVCDEKRKLTYISPCHAGCFDKELHPKSSHMIFTGCDCVKDPYEKCTDISDRISHVTIGFCATSCLLILPFLLLFAIYVLLAFLTSIPIQESELRSVPFELRSLAFGIRWIFIRLLGTIPGPMLMGWMVDESCVLRAGKNHGCALYNNQKLSTFVVICGAIIKSQVLLCLIFAWKTSKKRTSVAPSEKNSQNAIAFEAIVKDKAVQSE